MYANYRWTDATYHRIQILREYEPLQPFFFKALAEAAGHRALLDIGANVGMYSILFAGAGTAAVVAFEAAPDTAAELECNVALNELSDRVRIERRAVSSSAGTVSFGVLGSLSGANGVVSTNIHARSRLTGVINVPAVPLDALITALPAGPYAVKVDVEGHEADVIDGGSKFFADHSCVIQIEDYANASSIAQKLFDLGYHLLTRIGPDHYYSNMPVLRDPQVLLRCYESAGQALIEENHRPLSLPRSLRPVTIRMTAGIAVELRGRVAQLARRLTGRPVQNGAR